MTGCLHSWDLTGAPRDPHPVPGPWTEGRGTGTQDEPGVLPLNPSGGLGRYRTVGTGWSGTGGVVAMDSSPGASTASTRTTSFGTKDSPPAPGTPAVTPGPPRTTGATTTAPSIHSTRPPPLVSSVAPHVVQTGIQGVPGRRSYRVDMGVEVCVCGSDLSRHGGWAVRRGLVAPVTRTSRSGRLRHRWSPERASSGVRRHLFLEVVGGVVYPPGTNVGGRATGGFTLDGE